MKQDRSALLLFFVGVTIAMIGICMVFGIGVTFISIGIVAAVFAIAAVS